MTITITHDEYIDLKDTIALAFAATDDVKLGNRLSDAYFSLTERGIAQDYVMSALLNGTVRRYRDV